MNKKASQALARTTYRELLNAIAGLYEDARRSQVRFAWETGRRIVEVEQKGEIRAAYGSGIIAELSKDLSAKYGSGFSGTTLEGMRRFYLSNRISPPAEKLDWTKHLELLRVRDPQRRRSLEKLVITDGLKRAALRALIRKETGRAASTSKVAPVCRPPLGPLGRPAPEALKLDTVRLAKPEVAALRKVSRGEVLIDCGFFVYRAVAKADLEGRFAETPSYTYRATVERVVDGDTLVALIDTGFGNTLEEKLRLRGIDTPELGTPEGEKAKKFVEKLLPAGTLVVFKSQKSTDPHGRFVVDIFYGGETAEEIIESGLWLNQHLLDKGLAERMAE